METSIIISICVLLLIAYAFDVSSARTKIPSVILLLILGWLVRQATDLFSIFVPDLTPALPVLGTVGLILIVLEGSFELEINKSKLPVISKSILVSLFPMICFSAGLAYMLERFGYVSFKDGLSNAIPLAVISSAVAISSAQNLNAKDKEFIVYESSLSDIFGVIFFNFITINRKINGDSFGFFLFDLFIVLLITFVSTLGLSFLLSKIKHHVKFIPIILIIVLIYAISKIYHLPALIFILLLGIFMGNLDQLKNFKFIQILHPEILNKEIHKFKELTTEIAFLIRSLFFLVFGYLIETAELLNSKTILWALGISWSIFFLRYLALIIFKINLRPLIFLAPRGLITILLFLSIPIEQTTYLVNRSLIIQVIIITALIMMMGLLSNQKETPNEENQ